MLWAIFLRFIGSQCRSDCQFLCWIVTFDSLSVNLYANVRRWFEWAVLLEKIPGLLCSSTDLLGDIPPDDETSRAAAVVDHVTEKKRKISANDEKKYQNLFTAANLH